MAMYTLRFKKRAFRILKKLDKDIYQLIRFELKQLAKDPFSNPHVKKIQGIQLKIYRLQIGRWRILYFLIKEDKIIEVFDAFLKKSDADYNKRLK